MRKAIIIIATFLLMAASVFAQTDMAVLMCVTASDAMAAGEVTMMTRLEELGMVVDPVTSADVAGEDGLDYDMVFVHEAISSSSVGDKFKTIPVPLMSTEFYIADDMAFSGSEGGVDYGQLNENPQTDFLIVEPVEHPITEGFVGDVVVYDGVGNMGFAVPQGDCVSLLSYPENPDMSMLFTVEEGAADMNGDEVPARRVFFFTFNEYEAIMTDEAWTLFDNSVRWVLGIEDTTDTEVARMPTSTPQSFRLSQNYPNPFNPITTINYELANTSMVTLDIFDTRGAKIVTLVDAQQSAGSYAVRFDASDLPSGVYLYRLKGDDQILTKKMILAR
mgnify:CR=1 FL=1